MVWKRGQAFQKSHLDNKGPLGPSVLTEASGGQLGSRRLVEGRPGARERRRQHCQQAFLESARESQGLFS